ncbi:unnamed protein product (macronuclear) [Paramecium tetraurelia]|uniref:Uncharacterized protein n=1 Tax=Paramecium tetraurelia TaxID=5888 RepID=A0CE44_PARTE|nr:uncharacterized protein GSPATT00037497001 [Paramecium tetraurelia]CAK69061.1 unnamed protein product [Paramecium tetraurelia]|eukprot:XP_001436458.1 hypothetical protein (macronuclear) [Paramecium tetraurelia strain d4-2]
MKGKLVQSLINLFPNQHQEKLIKCVFIIGFDKLIKKGFLLNGKPKLQEIIDYSIKLEKSGRLDFAEQPCDVKHELDHLKDEISRLTSQIQYNNSMIQKQTQRSYERLILQNVSPQYDERKRSVSVGYKQQQQQLIKKKTKEITPKITETIPQTINQINITISKHHLDDTEIKSVMRDDQIRIKPPKPSKLNQDQIFKKHNQIEYQCIDTEEHPTYIDTESVPMKEYCIPQILQYSNLQSSQFSQNHQQQELQQQAQSNQLQQQSFNQLQPTQIQQLKQSQVSYQSNTRQSDHQTHNTNQTFSQPYSSQKHCVQPSKSPNSQSKSRSKSPKFKKQKKQTCKNNLDTVHEESFTIAKHQSSHSASSKGRGSHRQQKAQQNNQAVSKIKALLDQDKKIYKQHLLDMASERRSFLNNSEKMKRIQEENVTGKSQSKYQETSDQLNKRTLTNNSFYKQQQNEQISPLLDSESKGQGLDPLNQFQGSYSMTSSNRVGNYIINPHQQDNILIYGKYKQSIFDQYSPKVKYQARPQSVGKQLESDFKRSNDFNRSSFSSTFSMFNPNEELKIFFQNDFLERKRYFPQGYSDMTKQSSLNSSQDYNQHQSKYISTSQIEDQQNQSKNVFSPQQYQNVDKSNVFNNNRLSVTRILNNSQI